MRVFLSLLAGWACGGALLFVYLADHTIPMWLAPAVGSAVTFIALMLLKRT